ncbi:PREDICTED: platelet-activating factor acetylhydrolase IB subunit beta-like isoform X2 [Nicrophorus vespilloides]|uniref:Platelet-activating factor acetylhydrolase IB subunit beta-like isoform X2 n=1 Tax=Nicrophorus vespilloides TaxID=110193 RepID=A0ABM1NHN9_NICVS|nr:PREDICTED: platelet-activating factor acetylhydrolase IB subunit beta-like isoform X2 [Nicrophorus vespilloides]
MAESTHSIANHRCDNSNSRVNDAAAAADDNRLAEEMNNPCVIPARPEDVVGDKRWESMHKRYVTEARTSEPEVVFIGDSIVQQLQFSTIWTEKINSLHCLNFGIGGDRVEYVLWRILNGEFEFNVPIKAVVVFVGTNNTDCTPHEVFEGLLEIVRAVKSKLGGVAIVLPTLLPRGQNPNPYRERNDHVNTFLLDKFENPANAEPGLTENVHVVRIHGGIVQGDQTISHHVMHDYLHLTDSGYAKIFEPVHSKLMQILKN